ncbi:MAG: 50S ribosomal protein L29 [Candidatus Zambryskibacteria bacterium CG10_big_fil_rev_8_21_14_0_10_42_12]|uniref:Large ribosomal subunit protein uL29 n=1 Tax=Candidatus Zambryskibacteria bacterium CG10_big_fil_rev_8_21_14_0_10_42_12 TaxID=1975115 RepID=A0A2H0QWC7_9BACT|nr:MAG: 50S ribosomal protein L29 [Candidatus Zambryskibacteria bacterium CG10_big_fil_rev_8_21_14_0_10_42_12]
MKAKEIKEKNDKDLAKLLEEKRLLLRNFRFGIAGSRTRDVKEGKNAKKDIARMLTEINTRRKNA